MQSLFRIEYDAPARYSMFRQWGYSRNGLSQNMGVGSKFYQQAIKHANNANILVKMLYTMSVPQNSTAERVYVDVVGRTTKIARTMGLTSSVSKGSIFTNHFFGGDSKEVVVAHSSLFNVFDVEADWKNMRPLRVLSHPFGDLWGNVPDGNPNSKGGISFFSIDIPMMAVMYHCFLKEQAMNEEAGHPRKTPAQFVYAYVLANTYRDMIDVAVFNRMNSMLTGVPLNEAPKLHPFAVVDYRSSVDVGLGDQIEALRRLNRRLGPVLHQSKLIFAEDLMELSELPDIAPTVQCYWALVSSRLPMLSFALRTMGNPSVMDRTNVNLIKWSIDLHRTPNVIRNNLPMSAYMQLLPDLDYVMGL